MTSDRSAGYHRLALMTGRAARARKLSPTLLFLAAAIACGSSHDGANGEDPSGGGSSGTSSGVAGKGTNPPPSGTGGATGSNPGPTGGVGAATTTGGFQSAGTFGVAGTIGIAGAGGAIGVAGFGGTGGGSPGGGAGGTISYPPGSCPAQPPPNGTSCAAYHADPAFHCAYDAPACVVVSTCLADDKWRSGCETPAGEAGAPGDAGAGGS